MAKMNKETTNNKERFCYQNNAENVKAVAKTTIKIMDAILVVQSEA